MAFYLNNKGIGRTQDRRTKKKKFEKIIHDSEWINMMAACEDGGHPQWRRDHAIIFLGAALGMRRGEIHLYERRSFRDLESQCIIHAPTLKQSEKIEYKCVCGKKFRVKAASAGQPHKCWSCGETGTVPVPRGQLNSGVVEEQIDIVEQQTVAYLQDYMSLMRPDQRWLFEGKVHGEHISSGHVNRIFNTYAQKAGVDAIISFHALRHNRGIKLWSQFHDMIMCKKSLRHKDVKTTQIYADLDPEQSAQYKKQLERKAFDPLKRMKKNNHGQAAAE